MTGRANFPRAIAPTAKKHPARRVVHGLPLSDDFAWLRADNWRAVLKDPAALPAEIRMHLDSENAHAAALLAPSAALQDVLVREMRGRIREDDAEPPFRDGPFEYYERYRTGGEHPVLCRRPAGGGDETILLDGDAESAGKAFFDLSDHAHAPNHALLAWAADTQGSEYHTIRVRDVATGEDRDVIEETTGAVVWLKNATGFLYVRLDENHRDNRVYLHRLGTPQSSDRLLHEEQTPGLFVSISETQDRAFALIDIHDHETSEVLLVDPDRPDDVPRSVAPRLVGRRYDVEHHDGRLIIRTNADDAADYKIVTAPAADPHPRHWTELVPHEPGRLIGRMASFASHLVLLTRRDGVPSIVIRDWPSGASHAIAFSEETYALGFTPGFEHDTTSLRFTYSSLSTPQETFDYDMATRGRVLLKKREIPSGHDPARYVVRRINAPALDGETVPVSILHARTTPLDGTAPCLLAAYGAYGIVIPAGFRSNILSLVDRGFVFAIAHVRGGRDKGQRWYEDGKRERKTNTFTDYIASAEALVARRFTGTGRIVAQGGSAGGMLMGAIANLRPELFAGIIAEVPFVDVLNTMLDKDLPLTPPEWPEWGNPIESAADFATIRAYSPYDNVSAQAYPPILIEAGLTDPRVTYWEPAKWAAKLRATMTGGGPILLNTNMDAGHGGASGRLKQLKDDARAYGFALMATGLA
ncbi:MAG TPA: S9 family peptidase [Beijerinckiaceae bacterium]|nr:S9 family peptidase [Beijerinckiaceae bacterium]